MRRLLATAALLLLSNVAEACRCQPAIMNVSERMVSDYRNIARVFPYELRFIKSEENSHLDIALQGKVKILEVYKGSTESELKFTSTDFISSCALTLHFGVEYILAWNDEISLDSCSLNWVQLHRIGGRLSIEHAKPIVTNSTDAEIANMIKRRGKLPFQ